MLREPHVAGYFYPGRKEPLIRELSQKIDLLEQQMELLQEELTVRKEME